jgi:amino acid adenylation domain-containing protein
MMQIPTFGEALDAARAETLRLDLGGLAEAGIYRQPFEYYLMGTYPPIKAMYPVGEEEVFSNATGNYNVYTHIPFCEQYCSFCHFTKEINPKADRVTTYLDALLAEMDLVNRKLEGRLKAHTIYFGGGTPSYLRPQQLERLFAKLRSHLQITDATEISFELHPGVIHQPDYGERIKAIKAFGNNRWVFGVQSMDNAVLKKLNRGHTDKEVYELLNILERNGCANLSLDLIYGLPYQTLENWYATLTSLLRAGVEKFNIFPLMFKASDPITLHYQKEPEIFPDGQTRLLMHFMMEHILESLGFRRGPVLYYSKQKVHSSQQVSKFEKIADINLLPFGVSGFGYIGHTQYFNICDLSTYIQTVQSGRLPVWMGHTLPVEEQMRRAAMFSLRAGGVSRAEFKERFGLDPVDKFPEEFATLRRFGLIDETAERVSLNKEGGLLADGVGTLFASERINKRILETNTRIVNPRRDLIEKHDFSPIGRPSTPLVKITRQPAEEKSGEIGKGVAAHAQAVNTGGAAAAAPVRQADRAPAETKRQLSYAQQRLWLVDQLKGGRAAHNIGRAITISGELRTEALERAIHELARRHEALRTRFEAVDGEPFQVVEEEARLPLALEKIQADGAGSGLARAIRRAEAESDEIFDLGKAPLLRATLMELSPEEHVLTLVAHQLISDGRSMEILARDLCQLYEAFEAGQEPPPRTPGARYADYAASQRSRLANGDFEGQLEYWKTQLDGAAAAALDLATKRSKPEEANGRARREELTIGRELSGRIRRLAREEGASLFTALLGAYTTLLHRYSGQEEVVVGTPVANRDLAGTGESVGLFENTLALRADLKGKPSFRELIRRGRDAAREAFANQDAPFEKVVEAMRPERSSSLTPLTPARFALRCSPREPQTLKNAKLNHRALGSEAANFELNMTIVDTAAELNVGLEYDRDLYEEGAVKRMLGHFGRLLESIAADPDKKIGELAVMTDREVRAAGEWNSTDREYPRGSSFPELFERQVARTPGAVAVAHGETGLTYRELNERANQLAHYLKARGVGSESLVAVIMERSAQMLVSILACFKAGAAYVPVDPNYPGQRVRTIVEESGAAAVISSEENRWGVSGACRWIWLEGEKEALEALPADNPSTVTDPRNLAYVIYTSGSTGKPKGVLVEQRGMINHLYVKIEELGLSGNDRIAQTASQCFDISVWQFLAGLLVGGRIEIVGDAEARDPLKLLREVEARGVSVLETVPAMLRGMIDSLEEDVDARGLGLTGLRWLVATGEALEAELCRKWMRLRSGAKLLNAYGPTECSDDVTHYVIDREPEAGAAEVLIGRPLSNTKIYIVDGNNEALPVGVAGEICVGGEGVGRGYKNEAAKTAEAFIPDRFGGRAGGRIYRTGDLGRWTEDGNVEYLGRIDEQVKVRGYRVELGEIEATLEMHPAVKESVVVARGERGREKILVCYVVMGEDVGAGDLRGYLRERLPEYMAPSTFVRLEKIPLTQNGKVNRSALPPPDRAEAEGKAPYLAPRTSVEEILIEIWKSVLGKPQIGVADNFFELGGYSLLATQVVSRLKKKFQIDLPLRAIFESRTIAELAELVETLILEEVERMDEQETAQIV